MRTLISSVNRQNVRMLRSREELLRLFARRLLANLAWLTMMGISGTLISGFIMPNGGLLGTIAGGNIPDLQKYTSIVVASLNFIMPVFFVLLGDFEKYDSPSVAMTFSVMR
ncbi:hypothetical protein HDU93_005799 [Gonapodya sp. JEL0774]|nr:hypothetical protein HDU93_005799 [Gonapodya sp. JEL0774]